MPGGPLFGRFARSVLRRVRGPEGVEASADASSGSRLCWGGLGRPVCCKRRSRPARWRPKGHLRRVAVAVFIRANGSWPRETSVCGAKTRDANHLTTRRCRHRLSLSSGRSGGSERVGDGPDRGFGLSSFRRAAGGLSGPEVTSKSVGNGLRPEAGGEMAKSCFVRETPRGWKLRRKLPRGFLMGGGAEFRRPEFRIQISDRARPTLNSDCRMQIRFYRL